MCQIGVNRPARLFAQVRWNDGLGHDMFDALGRQSGFDENLILRVVF